jgi:hypothetical protein
MPDQAPLTRTLEAEVPARAAAADGNQVIDEAPFAGTVTAVTYIPEGAVSGANTDTRTIAVVNKGQSGSGSTSVASLALTSGVNLVANDEKALTLSGTPANLVVAAGDVLQFTSTHAGSTGLADPGGHVEVTISRS